MPESFSSRYELEPTVKWKPEDYITEDQVRAIQAKEWLTLEEAVLLLNMTPLMLPNVAVPSLDEVPQKMGILP